MRHRVPIAAVFLVGALTAGALAWWLGARKGVDVFDFYSKNMRGSFFAGFLTIGGFMLSLKTFILVKMKEGLYDSDAYRDRHARMASLGTSDSLYGPLRRLSELLFFSILAALTTSAAQLTLGLHPALWSASACISLASGTICLLLFSLLQIRANLNSWFDSLDGEHGSDARDATEKKR